MELYDPEFPCDSDITELPNNGQNDDESDNLSVTLTSNEDFSQLELSSIELPSTKDPTYQGPIVEQPNSKNETKATEVVSGLENEIYTAEVNSDSVVENAVSKVDDIDGEALDDETSYRDELKRSVVSRSTRDSGSKSNKDVPLEMYLGPSVGFRVDLTINKSRKSNVESIARRRHRLSDADLFERLSPEPLGKTKVKGREDGPQNGNKIEIKLPKLSSGVTKLDDVCKNDQHQKTEREEMRDHVLDDHQHFKKSPHKKEADSPIFLPLSCSEKAKSKDEYKSSEMHLSQKSKSIESEKENLDSLRKKHNEPSSDTKKSKGRLELGHKISERDGRNSGSSVKCGYEDGHMNEKDSREPSSKYNKHKDGHENKHHSKNQEKKTSKKDSGSKSQGRIRVKENDSDSDVELTQTRKKRRHSRSSSRGHTKMSVKKSKSNSPKRKRNKSKSRDRRNVRRSRSRSRNHERHHEKRSEVKSKHKVRHLEEPPTEKRRCHRSRSKSPMLDIESKRRKDHSRHSDFRESNFFDESWDNDARSSRNHKTHTKQSTARDLPDAGTSLFEACMRTRYEKRLNSDDPWRSRTRQDGINNSYSSSHDYGLAPSVDYITVSDSDEGIVWSDNDDGYENYSTLMTQPSASKKPKYEDIYSSRSFQNNENRTSVKSSKKKKSRREKEPSLSPSEILAINLKRKENARKRENLKITKSVSRSSLEPGEIDDRSSVSSADDIVENTLPSKRRVSLLNDGDGSRQPGDKVPIQIHVITSHGDAREKEETATDFDESIAGVVTTTGETESREKVPEKLPPGGKGESVRRRLLCDKEAASDATICSSNSSAMIERSDKTLKEIRKLISKVEDFNSRLSDVASGSCEEQGSETENRLKSRTETNSAENNIIAEASLEAADRTKTGQKFSKEEDISSPASQTIPGLGEPFPSPSKEKEKDVETSQISGRNIALSQPSFYQIKKKIQPEQLVTKSDNKADLATQKQLSHRSPLWKNVTPQSKDEGAKLQSSPKKSLMNENSVGATHQMPALVATNLPTLLTTAVSTSSSGVGSSVVCAVGEELPLSSTATDHRAGKSSLQTSNPPMMTNPFGLSQNAIMDLLTPLQNPVLPSFSLSSLMQATAPMTIATNDTSLSKLLAAITPSVTNLSSQKLVDDLLKASSVASTELSAKSQTSKAGNSDDQLSSLLGMQKQLSDLSRISNVTSHSSAPISQKLVQDLFKAVLPTISGVPDMSALCPRPTEIPCSLSDDDCMNEASLLDYRSPSFSPPSLPDKSSPGRNSDVLPSLQEMKSKGSKAKPKATDTLKSDGLVKEKMSKAEIQKVVIEHVKSVIRPFYSKGKINKDEYKEIMRKTVPKVCHSKTQDFSKTRITIYVEAYVRKVMATRKYNTKKKDQ